MGGGNCFCNSSPRRLRTGLPDRFTDAYFSALAASNPSSLLPLAANSKITANEELMPPAKTIWKNAEGAAVGFRKPMPYLTISRPGSRRVMAPAAVCLF
jgi:hypothetical protein